MQDAPKGGGILNATRSGVESSLLPVTVGALCFATLAKGGFAWEQGSLFALALVIACALTPVRAMRDLRPGLVAAAALGLGLVASAAANGWPEQSRQPIGTLVVAAAALIVGRGVIVRGERRMLLNALAAIGVAVAIAGMAGVSLHSTALATRAQGIWRVSSTLTYVNAAAALLTLTMFAALWVARDRHDAAGRIGLAIILAGLATSLSRAGIIGAIVGLCILAFAGGRDLLRGTTRSLLSAGILTLSLVPSIAGDFGRPFVAAGGLALALGVAIAPSVRRTVLIAVSVAIGVAAIVLAGPHVGALIEARISPASEDRLRTWSATWDVAWDRPLFGTGPGTFLIVESDGNAAVLTRFAHNEYLQSLAETGVVGVVSIGAAIAILAAWLRRCRPADPAERAIWALSAGACAAFALHTGFDFVWRMPLVVAVAFVWLAIGVMRPERKANHE